MASDWEGLRTLFAERADRFVSTLLPGRSDITVCHVPHHVAHAASAWGASPFESCAVMVLVGRGERGSYLADVADPAGFRALASQDLPHCLGLRYEELTAHLGCSPRSIRSPTFLPVARRSATSPQRVSLDAESIGYSTLRADEARRTNRGGPE
jgi:hypothetical protein